MAGCAEIGVMGGRWVGELEVDGLEDGHPPSGDIVKAANKCPHHRLLRQKKPGNTLNGNSSKNVSNKTELVEMLKDSN